MYPRVLLAAGLVMMASCGEVVQPGMQDGGSMIDADIIWEDAKLTECSVDSDCTGEHRACEWNGSYDECACAAGYSETAAGCAWTGGPSNAGFEDMSAWTVQGALLNPGGAGSSEPGEVFFTTDAVCNLGSVSQTVRMPSIEQGEPLVAEIVYRSAGGGEGGDLIGPAFAINGAWTMLPAASDWKTERRCLSNSGYGGDVTFEVSVADKAYSCPSNTSTTLSVDRFAVVPAMPDECPPPGTVRNGTFEDETGWSFSNSSIGAQAGIVEGAGESGSRAAQIQLTKNCTSASMSGKIVIPTPDVTPAPALQIWWKGAQGTPTTLRLGGRPLTTLHGTGSEQTTTFCLPPWTYGADWDITASLSSGGTCADVLDYTFAMDNLRITSTPACSLENQQGFESAPLPLLGTTIPRDGASEALDDASLALTGSGVLHLHVPGPCTSASYEGWVPTPASEGNNGPAVKLWYNVPTHAAANASYSAGGLLRAVSGGSFPEGGGWAQQVICLDPDFAGRLSRVSVSLNGGGACTVNSGAADAYFDDVEIGTDVSCPVE